MGLQKLFQMYFEKFLSEIVQLSQKEDPVLVVRSKTIPKIELNLEQELDPFLGMKLGVQIENNKIIIPKIPEELIEPLLAKTAFDWLFQPYLSKLPEPTHQFSFLIPWLVLKTGSWQTSWERLWKHVFPNSIFHEGMEFSRQYLLHSYAQDDILLFFDFHICIKAIIDSNTMKKHEIISSEMFLEEFFQQIFSIRGLNKTEKKIFAKAISLRSVDARKLGEVLKLPRSTAYKTVSRCLQKLHLGEQIILREYRLGLEPILLFFPNLHLKDVNPIEQRIRHLPYFYNLGHFITSENEWATKDEQTLLINLRFPGSFTYKLRHWVKQFAEDLQFKFHYFRWDRYEHGYSLQNFGIDVQTHYNFNLRGENDIKRINLTPGDLSIIEYRLVRPKAPSLHEVERITGIPIHIAHASEKRLISELIAGCDIAIVLNHILPVREIRLTIENPNLEEITYFRTKFPEYYLFQDVNDRELHVLLFVPNEHSHELEDWIKARSDRIRLWGFNLGLTWSHLFNYADLEPEYDYENNQWRDPFRNPDWWEW